MVVMMIPPRRAARTGPPDPPGRCAGRGPAMPERCCGGGREQRPPVSMTTTMMMMTMTTGRWLWRARETAIATIATSSSATTTAQRRGCCCFHRPFGGASIRSVGDGINPGTKTKTTTTVWVRVVAVDNLFPVEMPLIAEEVYLFSPKKNQMKFEKMKRCHVGVSRKGGQRTVFAPR